MNEGDPYSGAQINIFKTEQEHYFYKFQHHKISSQWDAVCVECKNLQFIFSQTTSSYKH